MLYSLARAGEMRTWVAFFGAKRLFLKNKMRTVRKEKE